MKESIIDNYICNVEYDKLSEIYDQYYSPKWPIDPNIQGFINYLKKWPGGDNIIELGVGTGNVAGKLYLEGYHNITGVDISHGMTTKLKYKCPKAKLRIENIEKTNFYGFDWILMPGSIQERIKEKKDFYHKMYNEMSNNCLLFLNLEENISNLDWKINPKEIYFNEYINENRGFKVQDRFMWPTLEHTKGLTTYTNLKTQESINYKFCLWLINQKNMIRMMNGIGFKLLDIGKDTGYFEDILTFKRTK